MEMPNLPITAVGSRRNEDIALDLLKFVAAYTDFGKGGAGGGVGFQNPSASKSQDQVDKLLELYSRCLHTVEGKK
jgi:hypothetical protein